MNVKRQSVGAQNIGEFDFCLTRCNSIAENHRFPNRGQFEFEAHRIIAYVGPLTLPLVENVFE